MGLCFVIQPFDNGPFDKRFEDVIAPAIKNTGLDPYRVDRDPSVSIPIDEIESGIRNADVCIADVTMDNPNVWFELGFAISSRKEVILLCSNQRKTPFPFDVQHRHIIRYKTDSPSDFEELKKEITKRLEAALKKRENLKSLSKDSPIATTEGLCHHEMIGLITVAENMDFLGDTVEVEAIRRDMEAYECTKLAVTLALASLADKRYILLAKNEWVDNDNNTIETTAYRISDKGMSWLQNNQDKLVLKKAKKKEPEIPF